MSTLDIPSVSLSDGHDLPLVGLGTYGLKGDEGVTAMASALELGYRLLDTATQYENEESVGAAIRAAGVPREELRIQTKLAGWDHAAGRTREGVEASLTALGVDYVDSYLIHWPNPSDDRYVEAWTAMLELQRAGLIRSVGVSNFKPAHLSRLHDETGVWPAVNQIQLSPLLARTGPRSFHAEHDIVTQAWGPLGLREHLAERPLLHDVAREVGRSASAVALRWAVQQGLVVIPKSSSPQRQRDNADLFTFDLSDAQMAALDGLDLGEAAAWDADEHEEK